MLLLFILFLIAELVNYILLLLLLLLELQGTFCYGSFLNNAKCSLHPCYFIRFEQLSWQLAAKLFVLCLHVTLNGSHSCWVEKMKYEVFKCIIVISSVPINFTKGAMLG